jgi:hypothetical protein
MFLNAALCCTPHLCSREGKWGRVGQLRQFAHLSDALQLARRPEALLFDCDGVR